MPYSNSEQRREYDKTYKRKHRAQGLTKKGLDNRLTEARCATAEDFRGMLNEIWADTRDDASLKPETRLRIQLRVVEVGLRLIETTDYERRIAALEEHENESTPVEN
jgi:hypothetical protein